MNATTERGGDNTEWTDEERQAMKDNQAEMKRARGTKGAAKAEAELQACLDAIAGFGPADRALAEEVHRVVTAAGPELAPKTWYGMPAYAKDGKVVVFFQPAEKFKARYSTLGFNDAANLDDGALWPTSFGIVSIGPAEEKAITELVQRALT